MGMLDFLGKKVAAGMGAMATPPVNFNTMVLLHASGAMVHLGEVANPETGKETVNLPMAKFSIDMLELLREKTRGNLTPDEQNFINGNLSTLRMKYVSKQG